MMGSFLKRVCLLLAILLVWWPADSGSSSMERTLRCGGRLVSIGDSRAEVKSKCGEPDRLSRWQQDQDTVVARIFDYETERYQAPVRVESPIRMETWFYDFSPTRLDRTLHFENDRLIRIETDPKVGD